MKNFFIKKLTNKKPLVLDGAMGTEILRRGLETKLPLWSASALLEHPDVIKQIHIDYITVGAEIIVTNTFRTTRRAFGKVGKAAKAREVTILACNLAKAAREETGTQEKVSIAGSVAPLEDCYSPNLVPSDSELQKEHKAYITDLRDGGVDFIFLETMNTIREAYIAAVAAKKIGIPFAVSFCCREDATLLSGELLKDAIKKIEPLGPLFFSINCVPPETITNISKKLRSFTNLPLAAYAQGDGGPDDQDGWKFSQKDNVKKYLSHVDTWIANGFQIIGGCCGTTPAYINKITKRIQTI